MFFGPAAATVATIIQPAFSDVGFSTLAIFHTIFPFFLLSACPSLATYLGGAEKVVNTRSLESGPGREDTK